MIQLECQVFFYNEEQNKLLDAGLKIEDDISKSDLMYHTFYNISYIAPQGSYCQVASGGEVFIVNESYDTIKNRIREQMVFKFN